MSGPYIPHVLEATSAVVIYYNPLYVEPQKVKNIGVDQLFISGQELIDRVISLIKTTPGRWQNDSSTWVAVLKTSHNLT